MKRAKMSLNYGKHGRGRAATAYEVVKDNLPRVDNRAVPCPSCGVGAKEQCVSATTGMPIQRAHTPRHRMATRKWNAEAEQRATAEAEANKDRVECPECHVMLLPRADGRVRAHQPNRPGTSHVGGTAHCKGTGLMPH